MGTTKTVRLFKLHDAAQTTAANTVASSKKFITNDNNPDGFFSCRVSLVGASAVVAVDYTVSYDGENFYVPQDKTGTVLEDSVIVAAHTAVTGEMIYEFKPIIAPFYGVEMTVTGANADNVTVELANQ
jgi:hypothetical protein